MCLTKRLLSEPLFSVGTGDDLEQKEPLLFIGPRTGSELDDVTLKLPFSPNNAIQLPYTLQLPSYNNTVIVILNINQ